MPRSVGLEIAHGSVRAIELDGTAKKCRITKFARSSFSLKEGEGREQELGAFIGDFFRKNGLSTGRVALVLNAAEATIREVTVPFTGHDQIRKTMKFEMEQHIHHRSIDDMVVDFYRVSEAEKSSTVLGVAFPKEPLSVTLEALEIGRVDAQVADLDLSCMFNALENAGMIDPKAATATVEMDEPFVRIIVSVNGRLKLMRSFRLFMPTLPSEEQMSPELKTDPLSTVPGDPASRQTQAAQPASASSMGGTDAIECKLDATSEKPATPGNGGVEVPVVRRQREFNEVLLDEIQRTLLSLAGADQPTKLILLGNPEKAGETAAYLAKELDVPVEAKGYEALAESALAPEQLRIAGFSGGAALIGAALKLMGADATQTDFRQEQLAFQNRFDVVKVPLALSLFLIIMLFLLVLIHIRSEGQRDKAALDRVYGAQLDAFAEVFPEGKAPPNESPSTKFLSMCAAEMEGAGDTASPLVGSALEHWSNIFKAIKELPPGTVQLSSIEASGSRSTVTLKAILPDATAAENLKNEINKFRQFDTRIEKLTPIKEGGVGADFRIELRKL